MLEIAPGEPGTWNLVGRGDTFPTLFFVLPPVVLVLAGALITVATRTRALLSGAIAGAAVTIGYLPLAVVGAFATPRTDR